MTRPTPKSYAKHDSKWASQGPDSDEHNPTLVGQVGRPAFGQFWPQSAQVGPTSAVAFTIRPKSVAGAKKPFTKCSWDHVCAFANALCFGEAASSPASTVRVSFRDTRRAPRDHVSSCLVHVEIVGIGVVPAMWELRCKSREVARDAWGTHEARQRTDASTLPKARSWGRPAPSLTAEAQEANAPLSPADKKYLDEAADPLPQTRRQVR